MAAIMRSGEKAALGALLLGVAVPTVASSATETPPSQTFEVAPFIGYQVGGSFSQNTTEQTVKLDDHGSFALALDAPADAGGQYELFYGRQSTVLRGDGFSSLSVAVEYLHIGGTVTLDDSSRVKPYLAGGLGVSRLSPDSPGAENDTRFSLSLALGLRMPLSQHFSVRVEGRGFLTLVNSEGALFCNSGESGAICTITAHGSTLFQFAFLAGMAYDF
jgi:opacity protein-like surface antigen